MRSVGAGSAASLRNPRGGRHCSRFRLVSRSTPQAATRPLSTPAARLCSACARASCGSMQVGARPRSGCLRRPHVCQILRAQDARKWRSLHCVLVEPSFAAANTTSARRRLGQFDTPPERHGVGLQVEHLHCGLGTAPLDYCSGKPRRRRGDEAQGSLPKMVMDHAALKIGMCIYAELDSLAFVSAKSRAGLMEWGYSTVHAGRSPKSGTPSRVSRPS